MAYSQFLDYLEATHCKAFPDLDKDHLSKRMDDIIIDCYLSSIGKLEGKRKIGHKLEILGFDFFIDEDFRVWLIEVNTCPYMGPVLTGQHSNFMVDMLNDTLKISVDKIFFG